MKLTYQTGVATLIQFIVLSFLNMANALYSIITTCHHPGGNCVENAFSSVVFYILVVGWFAAVWALGIAAQERRGRRLAQLLIAAEAAIGLVALFNIKLSLRYHNGVLSVFTSFVDLVLAFWVINLAFRLMRSGGRRVVARRSPKHPLSD